MRNRNLILIAFAIATPELLAAQTSPPETRAVKHAAKIEAFAFEPSRIEARPGDTIEWTNNDFAPHTATGDGDDWSTEPLNNGVSGRFIAASAGAFAYHCKFHPEMKGEIVVEDGAKPATPVQRHVEAKF